jgi:hypothetical protein
MHNIESFQTDVAYAHSSYKKFIVNKAYEFFDSVLTKNHILCDKYNYSFIPTENNFSFQSNENSSNVYIGELPPEFASYKQHNKLLETLSMNMKEYGLDCNLGTILPSYKGVFTKSDYTIKSVKNGEINFVHNKNKTISVNVGSGIQKTLAKGGSFHYADHDTVALIANDNKSFIELSDAWHKERMRVAGSSYF